MLRARGGHLGVAFPSEKPSEPSGPSVYTCRKMLWFDSPELMGRPQKACLAEAGLLTFETLCSLLGRLLPCMEEEVHIVLVHQRCAGIDKGRNGRERIGFVVPVERFQRVFVQFDY